MVNSMNNRNKEILEDFKTSMDGLTTKEAAKRLEKYGYNELPKEEIKPTEELLNELPKVKKDLKKLCIIKNNL